MPHLIEHIVGTIDFYLISNVSAELEEEATIATPKGSNVGSVKRMLI